MHKKKYAKQGKCLFPSSKRTLKGISTVLIRHFQQHPGPASDLSAPFRPTYFSLPGGPNQARLLRDSGWSHFSGDIYKTRVSGKNHSLAAANALRLYLILIIFPHPEPSRHSAKQHVGHHIEGITLIRADAVVRHMPFQGTGDKAYGDSGASTWTVSPIHQGTWKTAGFALGQEQKELSSSPGCHKSSFLHAPMTQQVQWN